MQLPGFIMALIKHSAISDRNLRVCYIIATLASHAKLPRVTKRKKNSRARREESLKPTPCSELGKDINVRLANEPAMKREAPSSALKNLSHVHPSDWKAFSSRLRWPLRFQFQFSLCRRRVNNKWNRKIGNALEIFISHSTIANFLKFYIFRFAMRKI